MEELEELDAHIAILKEGLRAKQPPLKVTIVTAIDTIIIIFIVTIILVVINSLNIVWKIVSSIQVAETRLAQRTHRPGKLKLLSQIFNNNHNLFLIFIEIMMTNISNDL